MLQLEDPTFKIKADKETGQTLMSGMGTLHLEVKKHRLERDFRLKVRVGKPRVSYRETLRETRTVEVEVRTIGQREVFAKLRVELTNRPSTTPVQVTNQLTSEMIPNTFSAAAESGLRDALQSGEFGFPMMNVQARLLDAAFDPVLSNEDAFVRAAVEAYREGTKGNVVLLEPIMKLTVKTPDEFLGNITGDLAKRGGEIEHTASYPGGQSEVIAKVALAKLFDYADRVRSLSQGRASATMEPFSYEPAPADVVRQMLGN
jgi:elongation factor G